jgi:hypothetical protein
MGVEGRGGFECWVNAYLRQGLLAYAFHPGGIMTELASRLPKHFHRKCSHRALSRIKGINLVAALLQDGEALAGDSIVYLTAKRREWLAGRFVNFNWDLLELMEMEKQIVEQDWLKFKLSGLAI